MTKQEKIDAIYQAYPRHVGVKKAKQSIAAALRSEDFEVLLNTTQEFARFVKRRSIPEKFIAMPSTWFNQERYKEPVGAYHPDYNKQVRASL